MPNSEELIAIRSRAIKEYQEQVIKEKNKVEKYLMESSIEYYNEYITPSLAHQAKTDISKKQCRTEKFLRNVGENDEKIIEILFNKVPFSCNFNILNKNNYFDYISISDDPICYIREYKNNQEQTFFVRISYIKKCSEKEKQIFITDNDNILGYDIKLEISKELPTLELPKHKVLTIKS